MPLLDASVSGKNGSLKLGMAKMGAFVITSFN